MVDISERELELPEAVIGKLLKISAESKDIISLSVGEPDFTTPKPLLDYAKTILPKATHYTSTSGRIELREALAKKLKKENKINLDPDNILVTNGSQEAILTGFLSTLDPTEQAIVPNPGYLAYIPAIELVSGHPVYVKLDEEDNFEFNPERIKENIDKKKTKVIMINTPSNPTGTVLSKSTLEEIADIAIEYDLYIFSDEAYEKLVYGKKHISIGSLNGMNEHVVTFQTFSKSYAMPGFRVGYAAGPEKLIKAMDKVHHYVTLCAPNVSQLMALKALSLPNKYIEDMRKEYDRRRKFIVNRLNELGLRTTMPNGAFYAFSNILDYTTDSFKFSEQLLKKTKVAVVPGVEFGRYGEGYIRFSYATDYKLIEKGMDRIEKFLKTY